MFIYKVRFPLLRAAGNTGSHCSSTRLLCGVGSSPCWRCFDPPCPGRHWQAEAQRHRGSVLQARLRPHLHSRCSYHSPSPAPALASGCRGSWKSPVVLLAAGKLQMGLGQGGDNEQELPAPAHQRCPNPQHQQHLPTHVVVGSRKAFTSAHRPRIR